MSTTSTDSGPLLLSDPRVAAVPLHENREPLVRLGAGFGPARALVRSSVAHRLDFAATMLPHGVRLRVLEGHRSLAAQRAIIASYSAGLRTAFPRVDEAELRRLTSRYVAPLEVAPHPAGAAVDLTLVDRRGAELDLGTAVDATPEVSRGACYFSSSAISAKARANRAVLADALGAAGLVNYPTEWWHWSFGDRYWALVTGAPAALYGPVDIVDAW